MTSVELAGRLCAVPIIDWNRGEGVLIGSGCGMMMAIMDETQLRWAVDSDSALGANWQDFIDAMVMNGHRVVLAGWFSNSSPRIFSCALERHPDLLVYGGSFKFGSANEAESLEDLIARIRASQP